MMNDPAAAPHAPLRGGGGAAAQRFDDSSRQTREG